MLDQDHEECSCDSGIDIADLVINDYKEGTQLNIIDTSYRYGFHVTKFPSMLKTILRVTRETPLCAMQVYISSPKSKIPPKFDYQDLMATRKEMIRSGIYVVIHGCLLYNLAGTVKGDKDSNYHQALASTLQGLVAELDFGVMLDAGIVVHPGARDKKFVTPDTGLERISKCINIALTRKTDESLKISKLLGITQAEVIKRRRIILENAAGEGNKLCSTFEEIAEVIKGVDKELRSQVKVCIDTAHIHGRGQYDLGVKGQIDKMYKDFKKIVGMEYLELFHFNDSMISDKKANDAPLGSRKDRHQQLGEGYIFGTDDRVDCITDFMLKARENGIAMIGEPPVSGMKDWVVVCGLLENTKYPLVEVISPK